MFINYHKQARKFILSLDDGSQAKAFHIIEILESLGSAIGMPHSRPLGRGLFELRGKRNVPIRLLYCYFENQAVILHVVIKKKQKIDKNDIDMARIRMRELT